MAGVLGRQERGDAGSVGETLTTVRSTASASLYSISESWALFAFLVAAVAFSSVAASGAPSTLWADDGVFLEVVLREGPLSSLTYAHHGYLNLGQMTIATLLEPIPIRAMSLAYVTAWAIVVGLLAAFTLNVSRRLFKTQRSAVVVAGSFALIPVAGAESVGSIANIQWYLLAATTFALAGNPTGTAHRAAPVVAFFTAASAPAAIALAPFMWWRRDRRAFVAAWLVGIAAQSVSVLAHWGERETGGNWTDLDQMMSSFVAMSGNGTVRTLAAPEALLPLAILGLVVIVIGQTQSRTTQHVPLILAFGAQWFFTFGAGNTHPAVPRYAIGAAIGFVALLLASVEQWRRIHIGVIAGLLLCWAGTFGASSYRSNGPDYVNQLNSTECVEGVAEVELAPTGWGAIDIPCGRL